MASSPATQVSSASIDQLNASVVTATKSAANIGWGSLYDPVTLAAGSPVHFHPMANGAQFLAMFSQRWTAATVSATQVGFYNSYTIDHTPTWFLTDRTGARTALGSTPVVPVSTPMDSLTLRDGTGRAPDYLYLLHTAMVGGVAQGFVQNIRMTINGVPSPVQEELIPNLVSPAVTFDKGVDFNTPNLTVYGTDTQGNLYMIRKGWGTIGAPVTAATPGWEYFTGSGWSAKPTDAAPMAGITSQGPVSVASYRNSRYISTVQANGAVRTAQVYSRYLGAKQKWTPLGAPVALGSTADGSYLGGTLQLQPQLLVDPSKINAPTADTAIPAVVSTKLRNLSEDSLVVAWSAVQIPRQS